MSSQRPRKSSETAEAQYTSMKSTSDITTSASHYIFSNNWEKNFVTSPTGLQINKYNMIPHLVIFKNVQMNAEK